jgi:hypothetical protein
MSLQNVPFFEYPRLWSDDRKEFLSIIEWLEYQLNYQHQYPQE